MSITIKNILVTIGEAQSSGFDITLDGVLYRLENFTLTQSLLYPTSLTFSLRKVPDEGIGEAQFQACGSLIGKEVTARVDTENVEQVSLQADRDSTAEVSFRGVIVSTGGSRNRTEYTVNVRALGWECLLEDAPNCKSFDQMTLSEIVQDVLSEYSDSLSAIVNPRFTDPIPYCVQYNETNYQFLQRLARRYGEWMYNDGERFLFGKLPEGEPVRLHYPSHDIPSYQVDLQIRPVAFSHLASSYNTHDYMQKLGVEEALRPYNPLADQTFSQSEHLYVKHTLQNLHSGGFADTDGREIILNVSTKTKARGTKAEMATYSGTTYCSKLCIGSKLVIVDNYLTQGYLSNEKSHVEQDEILIVGITHTFSDDETYRNDFIAIPAVCDYPPYGDTEVCPSCPSCRATVTDNEDPLGLGRVRVQFDWQAAQDSQMQTPWLRIAQPYSGLDKGVSLIPEIREEVMVDFEGANAERPYVKGALYNGEDHPDTGWLPSGNRSNQVKAIRTRNGHTIEIHDEGENGYIRIYDNLKENYILTFSTDEKLIRLESTGNIELYAQNDIVMHAGHDINASADNDIFFAAFHDLQRTADNDIREHAGNDRSSSIDRNDNLSVNENQFIKVGDNRDDQVAHKLQITAENIRTEAQDHLLEYSKIHHMKAENEAALNAGQKIDIKATIVKVN